MPNRISTSQIFDRTQKGVSQARQREAQSAEKASTGRELVRPSQNPSGYMVASAVKDDLSANEVIQKNASHGSRVLSMTETLFTQLQESAQRAYELAIGAAGEGGSSAKNREFALSELEMIYDGVIQVLNTKYSGRTILGGHQSDKAAFDPQGKFLGDKGKIEINIGKELRIPINLDATRSVLGQGVQNGVNILEPFQKLIVGLKTNNTKVIQETLPLFNGANDQISTVRGEIGARMSAIEREISNLKSNQIDGQQTVSEIEDADAIKVFSDLARDSTVLKAAISTSHKILSENPTDIFYR